MAHLTINPDGWVGLIEQASAEDCADLAERVGLTTEEIVDVLIAGASPTEHFVACCLYSLPVEFDDLFAVLPPANGLIVVSAA